MRLKQPGLTLLLSVSAILAPVVLRAAPQLLCLAMQEAPAAPIPNAASAPPVEELVALALQSAPSLVSLQAKVESARQAAVPESALPDPMAEIMLQDVGFPEFTVGQEEMSMVTLEVGQKIPFPGKRRIRRQSGEAEVGVRMAEVRSLQREIALQVRTLYAKIYVSDSERRLLESSRQLLELLSATAQSRYSVGEAEEEAVLKAQLAGFALEERMEDIRSERQTLLASLNRWLTPQGVEPSMEIRELPSVSIPPEPWKDLALAQSADLAMIRAELESAQRRLDVAKSDLKPDFFAGSAAPTFRASNGVKTPRTM